LSHTFFSDGRNINAHGFLPLSIPHATPQPILNQPASLPSSLPPSLPPSFFHSDPSTTSLDLWAWRLFDGNLLWHASLPSSPSSSSSSSPSGYLALLPARVAVVCGKGGRTVFVNVDNGLCDGEGPSLELEAVVGVVATEGGVVVVGEGKDRRAQALLVKMGEGKAEKVKAVATSDSGLLAHG